MTYQTIQFNYGGNIVKYVEGATKPTYITAVKFEIISKDEFYITVDDGAEAKTMGFFNTPFIYTNHVVK